MMTYPYVLRDEGGVKVVKPDNGKHSGYGVYADDALLCICTYRKGAFSVMDYILKLKTNKENTMLRRDKAKGAA